jgi:glycosyltransferase involved in cell wall biosynthesis
MAFVNLSMPTKTVEYMISGVPICVFAPCESALAQYATQNRWAYVITKNHVKIISDSIEKLFKNEELRQKISKTAIEVATVLHSTEIGKNIFYNLLDIHLK